MLRLIFFFWTRIWYAAISCVRCSWLHISYSPASPQSCRAKHQPLPETECWPAHGCRGSSCLPVHSWPPQGMSLGWTTSLSILGQVWTKSTAFLQRPHSREARLPSSVHRSRFPYPPASTFSLLYCSFPLPYPTLPKPTDQPNPSKSPPVLDQSILLSVIPHPHPLRSLHRLT